jgi:hypothetical protein
MTTLLPDATKLLERLARIDPGDEPEQFGQLRSLSLAASLLSLAEIDHEREYQLCAALARHLLGHVPQAEELGMEAEE